MDLLTKLHRIAALDIGTLRFVEPLRRHNSWRIGGNADLLIEPGDFHQIGRTIKAARSLQVPLVVIGQGTNLLFDDAGFRGVVLKCGERLAQIRIEGERIEAEGGAWVPQLARLAMRAGLTGLEHAIGIPGTVGGLVMMNGGSQRRGIGENVSRVWIIDSAGDLQILTSAQCGFAYRYSSLQGSGCVVTKVELHCPAGNVAQIRREMLEDLRVRRGKFPRKLPNCGSVFLSTTEMHASVGPPGKIIEEAGLKGFRIGQAEVSRQHANFIVNLGGATAADVLALIEHIRKTVYQRIGFELHCEVRYVNPQGTVIPAHLRDVSAAENC